MDIDHTPWGEVQQQEDVAEGIAWVSTAGHGGIVLSQERADELRRILPGLKAWTGNMRYLEEDCDWALAVLVWPDLFSCRDVYYALKCAERHHGIPDAYWLTDASMRAMEMSERYVCGEASAS